MLRFPPILAGKRNWMRGFHRPSKMIFLIFRLHISHPHLHSEIFYVGANAEGSTLNITRISRKHMGEYRCDANNGIPPAASQIFKIEVHCKLCLFYP